MQTVVSKINRKYKKKAHYHVTWRP